MAALREFMSEHVPEFMVPSAIVALDELPRTPNGKLDRNALPSPGSAVASEAGIPPRNEIEERLATIWQGVLGLERVGIYDNFFEVGGDSISSIQIISRANQAGLKLKPSQFFEHPTIAALAGVAVAPEAHVAAEPAPAGPVPLTPIQRWFFEQDIPDPSRWNQTLALDLSPDADIEQFGYALRTAAQRHDAFRLRYARDGGWTQRLAETEAACVRVEHYDITERPLAEHADAVQQIWTASQSGFDLAQGPLLHAAIVRRGDDRPYRLILTAHHLVVDVVTWQTVLADTETVYGQSSKGESAQVASPGTPFSQWAAALEQHARSAETQSERAYWFDQGEAITTLPTDGGGPNTERSAETVTVRLEPQETQALTAATAAYGMTVHELVLTALSGTLATWARASRVSIDFESHGRVELDEALDITRTAGWFTTVYPVALEPGPLDAPRHALMRVKEQLRAVPRQGIGYGLLRYLGETGDRERLSGMPTGVLFNYMGNAYPSFDDTSPFRGPVDLWGEHDPDGVRAHQVEINAIVKSGALTMRWTYSRAVHERATVERLAAATQTALQALVAHCLDPDAGAYTPSDFPDVDLSQDDLDALLGDFD